MDAQTFPVRLPAGFADGVFPAGCPSRTVLDHITSKWGVLILLALSEGEQRWSELRRRAEGVSEKMLAQTLQALEADGFVQRTAYPVVPPRVEYALTPLGAEAAAHVHALVDWIETNIGTILSRGGGAPLDAL